MRSMLSNLNQRIPIMRCKAFFAIWTLGMLFNKLDNLVLKYFGSFVDCADKLNLYANSLRVWLSPYKFRILYLDLSQSADLLQHRSKQFSTFSLTVYPWRTLISLAVCAVKLFFIGWKYSIVINRAKGAGWTDVLLIGNEFNSAKGTKNWGSLLNKHYKSIIQYFMLLTNFPIFI